MSEKYNTYQDMDIIMKNRRYFLNNISEKYKLNNDDFIDIDKINDTLSDIENDTLTKTKETLNDFVNEFYQWHEDQRYLTIKKEDWLEFITEYTR